MTETIVADDRYGRLRHWFRAFVHWASYNFILTSNTTRQVKIGDLDLTVPPTVLHPGVFVTSKMFAAYLRCSELRGLTIAEVGTGSGVLALSAACGGAARVVALDINPAAVEAAAMNAVKNDLADIVDARHSDILSSVGAGEEFDLIISSPPSFSGEPRDMADRAWHAGEGYSNLRSLFVQGYDRLRPDGQMIILLSSDTNIALLKSWAIAAGFSWTKIAAKSIGVESFILFRLNKGQTRSNFRPWLPSAAEIEARYMLRRLSNTIFN